MHAHSLQSKATHSQQLSHMVMVVQPDQTPQMRTVKAAGNIHSWLPAVCLRLLLQRGRGDPSSAVSLHSRDGDLSIRLEQARHVSLWQHVPEALAVGSRVERLEAVWQLEQRLAHAPPPGRHLLGHKAWVVPEGVLLVWEDAQLPRPFLGPECKQDAIPQCRAHS